MASHTILVKNIIRLQNFIARLQQRIAAVHFLSVVIDSEALIDLANNLTDPLSASKSTHQLWRLLEDLAVRILPSLTRLGSFSLASSEE